MAFGSFVCRFLKVKDSISHHFCFAGFSQATVEESDAPPGQSPAVEVLKFRDNNKYFASQ